MSALSLPVILQAEAQVLLDRHVRIERIGLEHHGDAAVGRLDVVDERLPPIDDLAFGDVFEAGDHPQQRRLSAARRADEDDEFAVGDLEVGAVDDLVGAEALDDISQRNTRHWRPFSLDRAGGNAGDEMALQQQRRGPASAPSASRRRP